MKLIISENSLRIDRIKIYYRQIVSLAQGFIFNDLQKIPHSVEKDGRITVNRNGMTAVLYRAGDQIVVEHFKLYNGIKTLRNVVHLDHKLKLLQSTDGEYNFFPINSINPDNISNFMLNQLPEYLEEASEAIYASMTSTMGSAIRQTTSDESMISTSHNGRTFSVTQIEGGADIIIPARYDILGNYNFQENMASLGVFDRPIWKTDKTKGEPKPNAPKDCWIIRGKLYKYGTPCIIYIKDKNDKDYWQIRFELKLSGYPLTKNFGKSTFSISDPKNKLKEKCQQLIIENVLPAAKQLFDLDYPDCQIETRDRAIKPTLAQALKTRAGHQQEMAHIKFITEKLNNNSNLLKLSDISNSAITDSIRNCELFRKTAKPGLYYLDRKGLRIMGAH